VAPLIQPRNDRILIERIEAPQQGIVLTDPDKSIRGKVLAVGPKVDTAKVGDLVLFNSKWNDFAGDHYEDLPLGADKRLHLIQEADVIGILDMSEYRPVHPCASFPVKYLQYSK
jgi:co-chaperonin GroES (HSP10)